MLWWYTYIYNFQEGAQTFPRFRGLLASSTFSEIVWGNEGHDSIMCGTRCNLQIYLFDFLEIELW